MSIFALYCVDRDSARAKEALAPIFASFLAIMPRTTLGDVYGITDELVPLAEMGAAAVLEGMPSHWIDDLCIVGDPDECAAQMRRFIEAGGDSIVLFPMPAERTEEMLHLTAEEVIPRL
jgi:alkanesulfonate monooxygenase SsuD/methylene tetrahydromethanopterin reductase-like flavin-dependent oxidoreductase (luciferase family)